ncbi:MAG: hypothetical protein K0Q48_668 [Bacillota bacterium]|jgi:hypothetical protein|nr:hypothetical protein [Bacillota bacterium]
MGFSVNHNEASKGGGLIPEGEYEVIIKEAFLDVTKGGTAFINIPMIVRNDVEQPYQGAYLWHSLWRRKEPTDGDLACDGFSIKQIQTLSKAAGLENGKQYADLSDWSLDLKHKPLRITVKHEDYNNKTSAKVGYINETKVGTVKHQFKSADLAPTGMEEIDEDDDMPF